MSSWVSDFFFLRHFAIAHLQIHTKLSQSVWLSISSFLIVFCWPWLTHGNFTMFEMFIQCLSFSKKDKLFGIFVNRLVACRQYFCLLVGPTINWLVSWLKFEWMHFFGGLNGHHINLSRKKGKSWDKWCFYSSSYFCH